MKEIKAIIAAYDKLDKSRTAAALATVVRVEGSSYRRMGARMLVTDDGVWIGGISGGCLEGDALKRARMAIAGAKPSLVTYDTTEDDAYQIGVGLGCNGIIDVLFTPLIFDDKQNPVEVLKTCQAESRMPHVLVTITSITNSLSAVCAGTVIKYEGLASLAILGDGAVVQHLDEAVGQQIAVAKSVSVNIEVDGTRVTAFIEILQPDVHLVLMGHQYDIYPLARLAHELGWPVTMVSNPLKINARLLDTVDQVLGYDQVKDIVFDNYTAIVLMAHDFKTDKRNLPFALSSGAFYIGMLGPRNRAEKVFAELQNQGLGIEQAEASRIFAPAGLDIGAVSPEEISLSILAEIRAVLAGRTGGFLRLRQSSIHERG